MRLIGIFLLSFFSFPSFPQERMEMLIFQIEGKDYLRESYDKEGNLINKDLIKVGMLNAMDEKLSLKVLIYSYHEDGTIKDSSITQYSCNPSEKKILMNVFPFAAFSGEKEINVKLSSKLELYPQPFKAGTKLKDIDFMVYIEGGALGFFGAMSKGTISNREVLFHTEAKTYSIISKIEIRSYLFGLNVKTIDYFLKETIHGEKGVLKQVYRAPAGAYFTIELQ